MIAVFFDLDGVIIESGAAIGESIDRTLLAAGLPPLEPHEIAPLVGPPIVDGFRGILRARGHDVSKAPAFVAAFRDVYADVSLRKTQLVPGIERAIADLTGFLLAVATSKARDLAVPILESLGLAQRFVAIVGPERYALDESKTQTLERAIKVTGAGAQRVMIGDRLHDIDAGQRNDCRTIGVTWGIGSRAELLSAGADAIVERTEDLAAAIRS